ncbi:hypothetical protein [Micromonospora sp. LOL_024]|uniref:hypothetical protein n=1 Tax=Micromonospora sp. LOL_024 TaxID=3345412 RepID=UPI003A83EE10
MAATSPPVAAIVRAGIPKGHDPLVRDAAVMLACAVAAAFTSDTASPVDRLTFGSGLARLATESRLAEQGRDRISEVAEALTPARSRNLELRPGMMTRNKHGAGLAGRHRDHRATRHQPRRHP